jgi:sorbitol-specific phosphotransferase system component IIC
VIIVPLSLFLMAIFNSLGSWLAKKYHPKLILSVSLSIVLIAWGIAPHSNSWDLFVFF